MKVRRQRYVPTPVEVSKVVKQLVLHRFQVHLVGKPHPTVVKYLNERPHLTHKVFKNTSPTRKMCSKYYTRTNMLIKVCGGLSVYKTLTPEEKALLRAILVVKNMSWDLLVTRKNRKRNNIVLTNLDLKVSYEEIEETIQ